MRYCAPMATPSRAAYLAHLEQLYGLGIKERENDCAAYDLYLDLMQPGTTLRGLLDETLAAQPLARLLDIGCGDAGMLRELCTVYGERLEAHGADLVPPADAAPVHAIGGDVLRAALPANCDLIVSFRALHEIGALDTMIPKLARLLAKGGRAFLSIRIAEFVDGRVEPQGSIVPRDVQWLKTTATAGMVAGVRLRVASVNAQAEVTLPLEPGAAPTTQEFAYLRGVNVFLHRPR